MQAFPTLVAHSAASSGLSPSCLNLQVMHHHRMRQAQNHDDWLYRSKVNTFDESNTFYAVSDSDSLDEHKPNLAPPAQIPRTRQHDGITTLYLAAWAMGDFDSCAGCSESRNWNKEDVSDAGSLNLSHSVSNSGSNSGSISTSDAGGGAGSDCISDLEEVEVDIVDEYDYRSFSSNSSHMESTSSRSSSGRSSCSRSAQTRIGAASDMRHRQERHSSPTSDSESDSWGFRSTSSADSSSMDCDASSFELELDQDQNQDTHERIELTPALDQGDQLASALPAGRRMTTRSLTKNQNRSGNRKRSRGSIAMESADRQSDESEVRSGTGSVASNKNKKPRRSIGSSSTTNTVPAFRTLRSSSAAAAAAATGNNGSRNWKKAAVTSGESRRP